MFSQLSQWVILLKRDVPCINLVEVQLKWSKQAYMTYWHCQRYTSDEFRKAWMNESIGDVRASEAYIWTRYDYDNFTWMGSAWIYHHARWNQIIFILVYLYREPQLSRRTLGSRPNSRKQALMEVNGTPWSCIFYLEEVVRVLHLNKEV